MFVTQLVTAPNVKVPATGDSAPIAPAPANVRIVPEAAGWTPVKKLASGDPLLPMRQ